MSNFGRLYSRNYGLEILKKKPDHDQEEELMDSLCKGDISQAFKTVK